MCRGAGPTVGARAHPRARGENQHQVCVYIDYCRRRHFRDILVTAARRAVVCGFVFERARCPERALLRLLYPFISWDRHRGLTTSPHDATAVLCSDRVVCTYFSQAISATHAICRTLTYRYPLLPSLAHTVSYNLVHFCF